MTFNPWQTSKSTTVLSKPSCPVHVVDAADVPGTGRFKAYSNGHISVVFNDRTILDVRNSNDHKKNDLQNRWCQLVLSNGNVQQFKLNDGEQCGFYKRYSVVKGKPIKKCSLFLDKVILSMGNVTILGYPM